MPTVVPTNNAPERLRTTAWLLGALLVIVVLRLWRLPEAGPPDFDSVRNWQVVQELARGDFAHLFHHGSPGFLLLFAPVALLTHDFLVFQLLNALLGVAGLGLFAAWVARRARLTGPETAGLVLLGGTGLLLTFSGRDFTMSSASLLVATGLLRSHFTRLHKAAPRRLVRVAVWLALGLCINYKFLFTVPILVLLEWWRADGLWRRSGSRALLVLAAPYLLLGLLGVAVGLPWYRWPGFYWRTVVPATANIAGRQATLHLDIEYYPRYLATFESPLLLLGLAVALGLVARQVRRGQLRRGQALALLPYLLVWSGCLLGGMSLLIKAPRGLLLAYLPLAALAVLSGRLLLPRRVLTAVLLAAVGLNVYRIQTQFFAPLPGRYLVVAAWLRQHGAARVASTVGNGLAPYLGPGQDLTVITDERELASLRRQGVQYVLLDGYWRVAGATRFDSLRRQVPVAAWLAPALHQPLLFLEHSEFTGRSFVETLAASRAAAADSLSLRLYRLR